MSTTAEPNFDWSQAASLLGDDPLQVSEDMASIAVELIEGANELMADLKKMDAKTQRKEIGSVAHQLRGSILNFGFTDVGALLAEIERGTYTPDKYPAMIEQADNVFIASKKMFAKRYSKLGLT